MNDSLHLFIDAAGWVSVALAVIGYIATNKRQAKKDAEDRAEKATAEQKAMHKENAEKLDELLEERRWIPPHTHIEDAGPLMAEGIRHRPVIQEPHGND